MFWNEFKVPLLFVSNGVSPADDNLSLMICTLSSHIVNVVLRYSRSHTVPNYAFRCLKFTVSRTNVVNTTRFLQVCLHFKLVCFCLWNVDFSGSINGAWDVPSSVFYLLWLWTLKCCSCLRGHDSLGFWGKTETETRCLAWHFWWKFALSLGGYQ